MKSLYVFIGLSAASLLAMIVVDFIIGPKAEFLNAYSVLQRMLGEAPSAGASLVARELGALGEFGVVLAANLAVGGILTAVFRTFVRPSP
ncbi:MAG: hypothetical protein R3357_09545 [Burkholderiales bacterium]|nr:hypothetical protein [Burkholderiales bacterium]